MKVQFEFAPIPGSNSEDVHYYPRVVNRKLVKTREITEEIQHACSLTETDVVAVLDALNRSVSKHLMNGYRVHLDGLGYFDVTLTCPEVKDPRKMWASNVKYKGVNFLPDKELKYRVGNLKAERSKAGGHSSKLSDIEIDMRLTEYFEEQPMLTRSKLQSICNMTKITAIRCLKRLISEEKIKNIGLKNQPVYVPVPGHYHVSVDRK
ncbi:HU family DNA-binding protein [Bacteroides sp.]